MLAAAPILTGTLTGDGTSTTLTQALSPTLSVPEQAGGLLDAKAITLQVGNNSGQTITGLTVLLQDTVGGLPVSASYPVSMTANLATGAAGQHLVTLSGSGIGSVVAVQATFASAPASAATVSLRAIVQTAGAAGDALVGSLAPHAYQKTQTITVPYSAFVTSGGAATSSTVTIPLSRNALRRLFILNNTTNGTLSGDTWPADPNNTGGAVFLGEANSVGAFSVVSDQQAPYTTWPGNGWTDSSEMRWSCGPGSTILTTGQLQIVLYEMF